jgi:hypothetical protein
MIIIINFSLIRIISAEAEYARSHMTRMKVASNVLASRSYVTFFYNHLIGTHDLWLNEFLLFPL